jgi:hypothetical protein
MPVKVGALTLIVETLGHKLTSSQQARADLLIKKTVGRSFSTQGSALAIFERKKFAQHRLIWENIYGYHSLLGKKGLHFWSIYSTPLSRFSFFGPIPCWL